ncbi:MAG: response regulator [Verrucomicrobia bacterium]|jgi:DNA-binding response OmpR family regulator|nr:response regulator [Verrucomicrobiota bacterium]
MTKRILIVDDEADFSELLQFRLRHLDYEVLAAASGTEALNKARSDLPDVILLDLLLPDFDGLTLCEILRRRSPTREIAIILITAVTSEATQYAAKVTGACAFLGKPPDFEQLKAHLKIALPSGACETVDQCGGLRRDIDG